MPAILPDLSIDRLGPCDHPSPVRSRRFVADSERILYSTSLDEVRLAFERGLVPSSFEAAGPRERIFFDPARTRAAIVTCGGLCPGLNDVIRALTIGLWHNYGVREILGLRYGYQGLVQRLGHEPVRLDPEVVDDIHQHGGTVLGSSREAQDVAEMVDFLDRYGIDILFTVGGDGTQHGAMAIADEVRRRGLRVAVVGIPKTIDNDIELIDQCFGFETAVAVSRQVLQAAHAEARGALDGIGLVKLMGRDSGFIVTHSALANSEVDVALIPEVPFDPDKLLAFLGERLARRKHAVVVVAEGAGQDLVPDAGDRPADSGPNRRLKDVGLWLKSLFERRFPEMGLHPSVKYFDPAYVIRSLPATADDSVFCLHLAQHAVHAAMAGRTSMLLGRFNGRFTHVPIRAAVGRRRKVDPDGLLWQSVSHAIGQPLSFC